MLQDYKDIYVIADCFENKVRKVTYELVGQARLMADALNEKVHVMLIGSEISYAAESLIHSGADFVHVFEHALLQRYNTDGYTKVICDYFKDNKPNGILIAATNDGRDLAPRISGRMQNGVCADCTILAVDEKDHLINWTRPALGGNILAEIICPDRRPQMGSVRPNVFKKPELDPTRTGTIDHVPVTLVDGDIRNRFIEMIRLENSDINIEEAEIIVAAGRGIGTKESFDRLQVLADLLGGVVGATRPLIEKGWAPLSRQIGQTGKTIAPKLYICFGVSGAIQHTAGVTGSELIVAINSNPEAPIFKVCDYGIVGDAPSMLEVMIQEVQVLKGA